MGKIKKLNLHINTNQDSGIFHDSRKDVNTLGKVLRLATQKIDELVEEVNQLKDDIVSK